MTKYIKDDKGRFKGSIGDGNVNIPSPQDEVVKNSLRNPASLDEPVSGANVSDVFAAYRSRVQSQQPQEQDSSASSFYAGQVDTSKYGTYKKPEAYPHEWRAADNLTVRWERNPLGFETATIELDMPGLIRGTDNLRDLIMDDKASVAMSNFAEELRRIADEMDNRAFDISEEENSRRTEEDSFGEDEEEYFTERTNEYLDEYEDSVPSENSDTDSTSFWDSEAKPPF